MHVTQKNTSVHPDGPHSHSDHHNHAHWHGSRKAESPASPQEPPINNPPGSALPRASKYHQLAAEVMSHYTDEAQSFVHAREHVIGQDQSVSGSALSRHSTASGKTGGPIATPDTGPHKAPYERSTKRKVRYFAKQDKYNKPEVKSRSHKRGNQESRPGVRVGSEADGHDLFTLKEGLDSASRYRLKSDNPYLGHGQYAAEKIDDIDRKRLQDWGHNPQNGKLRLMLNPTPPRRLVLEDGKPPQDCVLVFLVGRAHTAGATAWMRVEDLAGKAKDIKAACIKAAKHWNPERASKKEPLDRYEFRPFGDPVAMEDGTDKSEYIFPSFNSKGNHISDYLQKNPDRKSNNTFDEKKKHAYINICQSLPQEDAPPVPIDVARPGDSFFIPRDHSFHREVAVYKPNQKKSSRRQMWVYGFMGKLKNGQWVADRSRFGWVPLRTVKQWHSTPSVSSFAAPPDSQSLPPEHQP